MPFAYSDRLTRGQQRVYGHSDAIPTVAIPRVSEFVPLVTSVEQSLAGEDRLRTQSAADRLLVELTTRLRVQPLRFQDYKLRCLSDSFHTDGFYTRESSLLRQLLPTSASVRDSLDA